jgi:hypothetical protein
MSPIYLKSLELISLKLAISRDFYPTHKNIDPGATRTRLARISAFHSCQRPNINAACLRDWVLNHLYTIYNLSTSSIPIHYSIYQISRTHNFQSIHSERFQAQNHNPGIAGTRITHKSAFNSCQRPNINAACLRDWVLIYS